MTSDNRGYSLFELLIAIAVIGIVSALAIPAYRTYIETANMTKVTANFEQAIRVAQLSFSKDKTRRAIGLFDTLPSTTEAWITLLNKSGVQAPGGGPAYIASSNNQTTGRGNAETGAIGVNWIDSRSESVRANGTVRPAREARLDLWRPRYLSLREQRALVTEAGVDLRNQRLPED
ncbi:MAG: prepilin-type N-terminal cleavage/methylation domain-containing protein [Pseudomonadales bacterium]|nr:prepilin-type N-terminal cleavage/methylation domain-containing protein [Pseudomonadales bacterium]